MILQPAPLPELLEIRNLKLPEERFIDEPLPFQDLAFQMVISTLFEDDQVGILYDPDPDGMSSGKIATEFFESFITHPLVFINRGRKHGLNDAILKEIIDRRVKLLIIVDGGSNDREHIAELNSHGIKVIVLDHHELDSKEGLYSDMHVIINTLVGGNENLSGAGVTFKFFYNLARHMRHTDFVHDKYLHWVGLSVLSDVCSLYDAENRWFVRHLYANINNEPLFGVPRFFGSPRSLFSFQIIPRLNALLRMGHPELAINLVLERSERVLKNHWKTVETIYKEQRALVDQALAEAQIWKSDNLLVGISNAIPEISGLMANKLLSEHGVPSIVMTRTSEGGLAGSFRGHGKFDYLGHLQSQGVWSKGHKQAFGVRIDPGQGHLLQNLFNTFPAVEPDDDWIIDGSDFHKIMAIAPDLAKFNEVTDNNLKPFLVEVPLPNPIIESYAMGKLNIIKQGLWEIKDFTGKPIGKSIKVFITQDDGILGYQLLRYSA